MEGKTHLIHSSLKTASLALACEQRLVDFYSESAARMRPYDASICQLFDDLKWERNQQRRRLDDLTRAMFGALRVVTLQSRQKKPASPHFFVLARHEAVALLEKATLFECYASRFHARCIASEHYPQLQQIYRLFAESDKRRELTLQETVEKLETLAPGQAPHVREFGHNSSLALATE